MYTCGWEACDDERAGDQLAIRRHYETIHWQDGVFLQGTALMIKCGWPECRFSERGMRWDGKFCFTSCGHLFFCVLILLSIHLLTHVTS